MNLALVVWDNSVCDNQHVWKYWLWSDLYKNHELRMSSICEG
jgi:hypothetical protein